MQVLVSLRLGKSHTIELGLHLLFPLTMGALTWLLALAFFPRFCPGWTTAMHVVVAATVVLIDSLAGLVHELGHTLVAMARGRRLCRITLYGIAAAARRSEGPMRPRDQLAIAVAGPLSHLLLASLLFAVWNLLPDDDLPLHVVLGLTAVSNFAVGLLNLVPVMPLDGARIAGALAFRTGRPSPATSIHAGGPFRSRPVL
jgi:Zn-dependent protease